MANIDGPQNKYQSIFSERYCRNSPLLEVFSDRHKTELWRQLWINLAEAELELDLKQINREMIDEMKSQKNNIDWQKIREEEKNLRHDVMAHNHAYGAVCPKAAGIIHLGATSCYVQDNADLIIQKEALNYIIKRIAICLQRLSNFAKKFSETVTVGRTHYQAASFVTIGKRACIWAQDLLMALVNIQNFESNMRFRGIKGATGTQDSFLTLFKGDQSQVEKLDELVTKKAGFERKFQISGQTYSRQQDTFLLFGLSNFASVAKKLAMDIRILQGFGELSEPFETTQIGSSAMPYKRNPIRCERICGIARDLMLKVQNPLETFAEQGLERTLDDSSNRRIVIPDAFLAADAIVTTLQNVLEGLKVNEETISKNVANELPFLALEKALMLLTEQGVDRQMAHEVIRQTAMAAKNKQNIEGKNVTIDELLLSNDLFKGIRNEVIEMCEDPKNFVGRCVSQIEEFLTNELHPIIEPLLSRSEFINESIALEI